MRFDPTQLARFGGLALVARQVVEGFLSGVHRSPFKGYSVEFAEHREYYPGDEIRRIDWRAYGKMDKYFVKEYEDETNLRSVIVADASQSMAYRGASKLSKWEYTQHVAASLSYLLLSQLDAVGLLIHDTKARAFVPPKSSPKQLLEILSKLENTSTGGETSLGVTWEEIATRHLKSRGIVILISDCLDSLPPIRRALGRLRFRRHEVILFHVLASEEVHFPFQNSTRFRGLESPDSEWRADPRKIRAEYLKNFENHCQELKSICAECAVDYRLITTDEPVERALGRYITSRS